MAFIANNFLALFYYFSTVLGINKKSFSWSRCPELNRGPTPYHLVSAVQFRSIGNVCKDKTYYMTDCITQSQRPLLKPREFQNKITATLLFNW